MIGARMNHTATPFLEATGLHKQLGGKTVVEHVDLVCNGGEVLALLGPNGAGKTTTLRMCYGYLRADRGTVRIAGHDLAREPDAARRLLGVCTQDDTFDADFTVRGNLEQTGRYFQPRVRNLSSRIDAVIDQFGLREFANAKPDTLSGGYKRRLMIARAIIHEPKVVFLDEPTTGLDPQARMAVWELCSSLRSQGLAVVLTTHYMDEASKLADRLQVLQAGKVRAMGSPKHVLGDIVGEHVIVLPGDDPHAERATAWCKARGMHPSQILGQWHIAAKSGDLAAFVASFPDAQCEVRQPTLDDLFVSLAGEERKEVVA